INEKNVGFVRNFERAISRCKGRYIALADQDDVWLPKKLETLAKNICHHSLICSDACLIDQNGKIINKSYKNYARLIVKTGKSFKTLVYHNFVPGCTTLFKQELLTKALPIPEDAKYHDWWLAIVASKMDGIKFLDTPLIFYRLHPSGHTGATKKLGLLQDIIAFFSNKAKNERRERKKQEIKMNYERIKAIITSPIFNNSEKEYLKEAIEYYGDIFKSHLPLKALRIGIKNRDFIYARAHGLRKWIHIFFNFISQTLI
ncbi:MAG: glycosyltransferase, partial [Candidatus Hodarchaeota archaeon]